VAPAPESYAICISVNASAVAGWVGGNPEYAGRIYGGLDPMRQRHEPRLHGPRLFRPGSARVTWWATSLTIVVAALLLSGCSPRRGAELLVLGSDVSQAADITYGPGERGRLDVYRRRAAVEPLPVVIFLYGGRWKYGDKRDYLLLGAAFARQGWLVIVPDYRVYPEVIFPGWVEDAASAVGWTVKNAAQFGGDPTRIIVVGHSAGAHTAAILALDDQYLRAAGVDPGVLRGIASVAGPVDTTWTAPDVQRLMGPREQWASTYASELVRGDAAPILLLHGRRDDVVTVGNSVRLASAIREAGGCARAVTYREIGHIRIAVALAIPALERAKVLQDLTRFVDDPARECARPM
jgi:acetyl esterase/lipase